MTFAPTYTFTDGTIADADQVNQNFADAGAYADSQMGVALGTYRQLLHRAGEFTGATAATRALIEGAGVPVAPSASALPLYAVYLDPADYTAGARANKYRLRAQCHANTTPPGINFTVGLYPVTPSYVSGQPVFGTLGTVVPGSTVTFTTPSASSSTQNNSGDFAAPAAGYYAAAVVVSGSQALNSFVEILADLQMREV